MVLKFFKKRKLTEFCSLQILSKYEKIVTNRETSGFYGFEKILV